MDVGLLVMRVVVGLLLAGHGSQKLFGWFHGRGRARTGEVMESLGLRPGRAMAVMAGMGELAGGLLFAAGLLTPLGAALIIAVMITAIATAHRGRPIWSTEGGYEYNLVIIAAAFAVTASGPGELSLDYALDIDAVGIDWALSALGAGALGALIAVMIGRAQERATPSRHRPAGA
jgi:putative oxidoreductase